MKNSLLVVLAVLSIIAIPYLLRPTPIIKSPIKRSLDATCTIVIDEGNLGTAVLLDTGYLLTAGHCIDVDYDDVLDKNEKDISVAFGLGIKRDARVIYFGDDDFAFLELVEPCDRDGVDFVTYSDIGDKVYTIGATLGRPLVISDGYIGLPMMGWSRATCYVAGGNSGGGIFNKSGDVTGVVSRVATIPMVSRFLMPIFYPGGEMGLVEGYAQGVTTVNGLCSFVSAKEIQYELRKKNLEILIHKEPEETISDRITGPWGVAAIRIAIMECSFLVFVFFAWKNLLR